MTNAELSALESNPLVHVRGPEWQSLWRRRPHGYSREVCFISPDTGRVDSRPSESIYYGDRFLNGTNLTFNELAVELRSALRAQIGVEALPNVGFRVTTNFTGIVPGVTIRVPRSEDTHTRGEVRELLNAARSIVHEHVMNYTQYFPNGDIYECSTTCFSRRWLK